MTYAIGDVHGCDDALSQLLDLIKPSSKDTIYFVGDILDKGGKQLECLERIYNLQRRTGATVKCVMGNHDNKFVRWYKHHLNEIETGKKNPMTSVKEKHVAIYSKIPTDQAQWLIGLPVVLYLPEFNSVVVHGGLFPESKIPFAKQCSKRFYPELMRMRWLDRDTLNFVAITSTKEQPPNTILWSEAWDGKYNVIYGHITHSTDSPRIDVNDKGAQCIGIDTGAVVGGNLTAFVLDSQETLQVKSKQYVFEDDEEY